MYLQVIMPVGADPRREEKEAIIRRAAAARELSVHLPSYSAQDPVFNVHSALEDLRGAEFVVADLSFERPSCYYELGLAEALGKPVFLVAEEGTAIHQTAARQLVKFFRNLEEFRECIEGIIGQVARAEEIGDQGRLRLHAG